MIPWKELAFGLLSVLALLAGVMTYLGRGFTRPGLGLEVELAKQGAFDVLVGTNEASAPDRRLLTWSQYWDFPFIAAYLALFWVLGTVESAAGFPGARAFGWLVRGAIVLAAGFDVLEDAAILRALAGRFDGAIRTFGLPKWSFFFVAATLLALLFLLRPGNHFIGLMTGGLLMAGGILGLAALVVGDEKLVGTIQRGFFTVVVGLATVFFSLGYVLRDPRVGP
jgi:hypothetical protein